MKNYIYTLSLSLIWTLLIIITYFIMLHNIFIGNSLLVFFFIMKIYYTVPCLILIFSNNLDEKLYLKVKNQKGINKFKTYNLFIKKEIWKIFK